MENNMENKDSKLARNLIIGIIILFIVLLIFSKQISALFQNPSLYVPTSFLGLELFQILNLIFCLLFFSIFSVLGFKKAKQKGLNPALWAFICFLFNFWGYIGLLYYKRRNWTQLHITSRFSLTGRGERFAVYFISEFPSLLIKLSFPACNWTFRSPVKVPIIFWWAG